MANTRQSGKRAKQERTRQERNTRNRSIVKTAIKKAVDAVKSQDLKQAKEAYHLAIKAIDKAASKGAIPKTRAARKISRLTLMAKKTIPAFLGK